MWVTHLNRNTLLLSGGFRQTYIDTWFCVVLALCQCREKDVCFFVGLILTDRASHLKNKSETIVWVDLLVCLS